MLKKSVLAALTGGLALAGVCSSQAGAVTVVDQYWGGVPNQGTNAEIIGGDEFSVESLTATRSGSNLTVTVNTNYMNFIGQAGTSVGSLFIGSGNPGLVGTGPEYKDDTYLASPSRFSYVFDYDVANSAVTGGAGTGSLWKISGPSDVQLAFPDVLSTTIRKNQAVDRTGGTDTGTNGTWSITKGAGAGSITFTIADFFKNTIDSTSLILAWTMTCGNDVVLASGLNLSDPGQGTDVPLPAGVWLLMSGLAGVGYVKRRQKKNTTEA